jgi:hypothetical protein
MLLWRKRLRPELTMLPFSLGLLASLACTRSLGALVGAEGAVKELRYGAEMVADKGFDVLLAVAAVD